MTNKFFRLFASQLRQVTALADGPAAVAYQLGYSAADPHVTVLNPGCGCCIFDGGENDLVPCAQIWVHVKKLNVVETSIVLHYGVSHEHMVVLGRQVLRINH